jgi:cation diffusion facilitator CzcD-associated flavoprotein CzcO
MTEVREREYDVLVVGAGFGGLYALYRLREQGYSVRVFERGDGVGGTWFWNRYPGARCDVESLEYSYSFSPELEQEWEWTEKFPPQGEILAYLNHVADRFDLRRDIQFETTVESAQYDDEADLWTLETDDGERYRARFVVTAAGCLSSRKDPHKEFPGLDSFQGDWYLTSAWPQEGVDVTGKRVAVIGTGSTAVQVIPQVAKTASHVTVLQRTANFSVPAQNHPMDAEFQRELKGRYRAHRQAAKESLFGVPLPPPTRSALELTIDEVNDDLDRRWQEGGAAPFMMAYTDVLTSREANELVCEFVRQKIRATVHDPETAELLCPTGYPIGTKRLCVDIDYFETYNRDNVSLVSVRGNPITQITPTGIRLEDGQEFEADVIIFAIGFDAMTGALFDIDIRGRGDVALRDKWAAGPRTYLGLSTRGFPNMFMITGPGSPSVLSNMVVSIEQHVDWITDLLDYMRERRLGVAEATLEAEDAWVQHVHDVGHSTLFPECPNSWYVGANVPGKLRVFTPYIGGVGFYRQKCDQVAADGYEGFDLTSARELAPA